MLHRQAVSCGSCSGGAWTPGATVLLPPWLASPPHAPGWPLPRVPLAPFYSFRISGSKYREAAEPLFLAISFPIYLLDWIATPALNVYLPISLSFYSCSCFCFCFCYSAHERTMLAALPLGKSLNSC